MNYRQLASMIPARYRERILTENIIFQAMPVAGNVYMKILFTIWVEYISPLDKNNADCLACMDRIHKSFKAIEGTLIELSKEDKLLEL